MRTVHYVFAFVLLVAAGLKARSILFPLWNSSSADGWPTWARWLVVAVEWALATWLLTGLAPGPARRAAMGLLAVFIAVSGWRLLQGETDCGCFGGLRVHPAWTLAFNCVILAGFAWARPRSAAETPADITMTGRGPRVTFAIVLSALLPTAIVATTYLRIALSDPQRIVVIEPDTWSGKTFPLLEFVTDDAARADLAADWRTVILFNRGCGRCREHLAKLVRDAETSEALAHIRIIDIAPNDANESVPLHPALTEVHLRRGHRYLADVPWEITLNNCVVKSATQSDR